MFAVDDAHYMDPESWELVEELGCDTHALVLLSIKDDSRFIQHKSVQSVLQHSTTINIELSGAWLLQSNSGCISLFQKLTAKTILVLSFTLHILYRSVYLQIYSAF